MVVWQQVGHLALDELHLAYFSQDFLHHRGVKWGGGLAGRLAEKLDLGLGSVPWPSPINRIDLSLASPHISPLSTLTALARGPR